MERDILVKKIDKAVEELHDELVAFACGIFSIPTQNPPGYNYDKCTKAIGHMMEKIGMDVEYVHVPEERLAELAPGGEGLPRMSVIGTLKGAEARPNIHFTGHYDVVPEGTGWTHDPYACEIVDGNIYARGSGDQKAGLTQCVVYGPGRLTLAHKADEYQNIEEMKTSAKIMALTAAELLGVVE